MSRCASSLPSLYIILYHNADANASCKRKTNCACLHNARYASLSDKSAQVHSHRSKPCP